MVGAFHGVHIHAGSGRTKGVADILGGVVALLFGLAVATGLVARARQRRVPGNAGRFKARLDRGLTVPTAAVAGPLTHIPGVFYIIALNVIVAHEPNVPGGLLAIVVYDATWFAVPIAALALSVVKPSAASDAVLWAQRWTERHSRAIALTVASGSASPSSSGARCRCDQGATERKGRRTRPSAGGECRWHQRLNASRFPRNGPESPCLPRGARAGRRRPACDRSTWCGCGRS